MQMFVPIIYRKLPARRSIPNIDIQQLLTSIIVLPYVITNDAQPPSLSKVASIVLLA